MKKELPRICYILGGEDTPLEIGETFEVESEECSFYKKAYVDEYGIVYAGIGNAMNGNGICRLIQGGLKIIRRPRYTDQDIAIMRGRVAEGTPWVARDDDKFLCAYKEEPERIRVGWYTDDDFYDINGDLLSWIKPGECVDLRDIVGGG